MFSSGGERKAELQIRLIQRNQTPKDRLVHLLPKAELLARRKFQTKAEARMAIFEFIEGWYNPGRRHSALGYQSPINYEKQTQIRLSNVSP